MKVIVSGGWSYGNIGDDALLEATASLMARHFSAAEIVWTTYDVDFARESGIVLPGRLIPSMHRLIDRRHAFWLLQTVGRVPGYFGWPRRLRKLGDRFFRPFAEGHDARRDTTPDPSAEFADANLFLMSGGGYFNRWDTMFQARVREIELAHASRCDVVLMGQSIGPFEPAQREILRRTLRPTDRICVRDPDSVAELAALGIHADLAPDIAMGFPGDPRIESGLITVVPGELDRRRERSLVDGLTAFVRQAGSGVRIRLTQTCAIWTDVVTLNRVARALAASGIVADVVMPKNYAELKAAIEGSEWVVSRRMHAMVLGWRTGSRVFALTDSRKIRGFMEACGTPANILKEDDWGQLAESLLRARSVPPVPDRRGEIAAAVDAAFARVTAVR